MKIDEYIEIVLQIQQADRNGSAYQAINQATRDRRICKRHVAVVSWLPVHRRNLNYCLISAFVTVHGDMRKGTRFWQSMTSVAEWVDISGGSLVKMELVMNVANSHGVQP